MVLRVITLFLFCCLVGISVRSGSVERYLFHLDRYYDVEHYVTIAMQGYTDPSIAAFSPLWPLILRVLGALLQLGTRAEFALLAGLLSTMLFFATLFFFDRLLTPILSDTHRAFVLVLFALNPASIFHVLGFSESLCALLLVLIMIEMQAGVASNLKLFTLALLLSLTRPVVYFLPLATLFAMYATTLKWRAGSAIVGGAIVAFVLQGSYTYFSFGDFFAQSHAQQTWGRQLGLHWQLLYHPKSVGGSPEVMVWDAFAFWSALFLFAWTVVAIVRKKYPLIVADPAYRFAVALTALQSVVAFLTYPIFASTARHNLALPCLFYTLAKVLPTLKEPKNRTLNSTSASCILIALISIAFFIRWWARFAKGSWIG